MNTETPKFKNLKKALPNRVVEGEEKAWLLGRMSHCGSCDQTDFFAIAYDKQSKPYPKYKCGACPNCNQPITSKADNKYFYCPIGKFEAEAW